MRASFAETLEEACNILAAAKRLAKSLAKSCPDDKTMQQNREILADVKKCVSEIDAVVNPKRKKRI